MARVFVSFLGMGEYSAAEYRSWRGDDSPRETKFVQTAILHLWPHRSIDKIVILQTTRSSVKHGTDLARDFEQIGVDPSKVVPLHIDDDISKLDAAWEWFERLQSQFQYGDHLVLDVTHGFRIVPIVFSAAVGYLKRVKNVQVDAVLYGAHDVTGKPIVDVKDFYTISEWTEGVGRLVDTADASFLRGVAERERTGSFVGLNDKPLLDALESLTQAFRNVELQAIEGKARTALELICKHRDCSRPMESQILTMIIDKFCPLLSDPPANGEYTVGYLRVQLKLIAMLAEYGLHMQAFTAMREWLGSLGLVLSEEKYRFVSSETKKGQEVVRLAKSKDGPARRKADVFLGMLSHPEPEWTFPEGRASGVEAMKPSYDRIECLLDIDDLRMRLKEATKIRNGFSHGWTGENISQIGAIDFGGKARETVTLFGRILDRLDEVNTA